MAPVVPTRDEVTLLLESLDEGERQLRMAHIALQLELHDTARAGVWVGAGRQFREAVRRLVIVEAIARAAQGTLK